MTIGQPVVRTFEETIDEQEGPWYELTLIVCGGSNLSTRAIANATEFCDTYLRGRHQLHVVDLNEAPASLLTQDVIAAPTLVRTRPLPVMKFVGDLSKIDKLLDAFGLSDDCRI